MFLYGLRTKPLTSQTPVNTTLKQVSDIVAQSLNIRQENICKCPVIVCLFFVWINSNVDKYMDDSVLVNKKKLLFLTTPTVLEVI